MRTNGSYVQRKGSSVVWRFEDADLEFGAQQAKEMREHLDNLLQGYPVDVQVGKGYVEIKPAGVDKGVIVSLMLNHLAASSGGVDFVLCVGDDSSDEKMFEALNSRFGGTAGAPTSPRGLLHGHTHVFCATVGRKPSAAPFYMNDHEEVLELLQSLRLHSTRSNRNRSLTDLKRLGNAAERNAAPAPGERGSIGRSTAGGGQHSAALANAVSTLAGGGASAGPAGRPYEHGPPIGSNSPSCAARSAGAMASGLYRQPGASYARSSDILPSSSATPSAGRTASMVSASSCRSPAQSLIPTPPVSHTPLTDAHSSARAFNRGPSALGLVSLCTAGGRVNARQRLLGAHHAHQRPHHACNLGSQWRRALAMRCHARVRMRRCVLPAQGSGAQRTAPSLSRLALYRGQCALRGEIDALSCSWDRIDVLSIYGPS